MMPEPVVVFGFEENTTQPCGAESSGVIYQSCRGPERQGPPGGGPVSVPGPRGRAQACTAAWAMSAPPALQIREANAHLAAVHRRAAELEARLDAAERTVHAQAERLALHDQHLRAALDELGRAKDREIATLREQLMTSEATVRSLQAAVHRRDELIRQLQQRAELLQDICHHRPPLAGLLAVLAEAERLGPLPASNPSHAPPGGPGPPVANSTGEEADRDHLQPAVFGTTV
nr:vimentin-type intermediate filament-associated coiled-coil protein [Callithrix jacchus]